MMRSLVLPALTVALVIAAFGCNERRHATRRARPHGAQPTAVAPPARAPAAAPAVAAPPGPAAAMVPPASGVAGQGGARGVPAPAGATVAVRPSLAGAAGAAGATTPEMAVVILMLPGAGDPAHPGTGSNRASSGAPLTYRLSLVPGAQNATIELEGRPPVVAPVQRVYPSPPVSPSSLALLRSLPAAPPSKAPARATAAPAPGGGPAYGPASPRARTLAPPSPLPALNSRTDQANTVADPRASRISGRAIPTATRLPLAPPEIEFTSANGAPIIE